MTSLLGKLRLVVVLSVLGCYAFAKANSPQADCVTAYFTTVTTYTIDKFIDRDELFAMMQTLKTNHQITANLTGYKRDAGVLVVLGMQFTSATGVVTNMYHEKPQGIADLCILVNSVSNELESARTCEVVKSAETVATAVRDARQERLDAVRERIATSQEAANLRLEQQREENRILLLERKAAMAARIATSRKRTDSITQATMLAREEQRLELQRKSDARKAELEQARLEAIEAEKLAIAAQTAALQEKAREEQQKLEALQLEKERVIQDGLRQQEEAVAARVTAQRKKDSLLQLQRGAKRERLTIERVRLEKAQAMRERMIEARNELETLRLAQEQKLKQLEQAANNSKEIIALRKEQNDLKTKMALLDLERKQVDAELSESLVNEDFLYEGFLNFNADQCYYKVAAGITYVFDNLGALLFVLDNELEPGNSSGTLTIREKSYAYELANDVLIIKDSDGVIVNQYGTPAESLTKRESVPAARTPFKVDKEFIINGTTTQQDIDALSIAIEELGHQFQLYDFERSQSGGFNKVVFFIDENNYTFSMPDGIPAIIIQYDKDQNTMRVKAGS